MTNITPKMTEKEKKVKSAELSDDMLGNVAGGAETLRGGNSPKTKPSNNDTNELSDDMLGNVSGGEGIYSEVTALMPCAVCGTLYPMGDRCPKCTAVSEYEAQE